MKPTRQTLHPLLTHTAPRHHLFTRFTTSQSTTAILLPRRTFHNTPRPSKDFKPAPNPSSFSQFSRGPSPPQLPPEEQAIFESLQRQSTGAFSTPRRSPPKINQSPDSTPSEVSAAEAETVKRAEKMADEAQGQPPQQSEAGMKEFQARIKAKGDGEELHPNVRRGARPEFEGDVNPKTGEVGGPKNEPLRWGAAGEWSYNGRTTDF